MRQHSWFFSVIWFDFLPFESVVVEEKREMIAVHLTFSNSVEECNFAFFPFLPKLSKERESESCSFPRKNCTLLYSSEAGLKKSKHHQTVYEITVNVTIYVTTHFCKKVSFTRFDFIFMLSLDLKFMNWESTWFLEGFQWILRISKMLPISWISRILWISRTPLISRISWILQI